MLSKQLDELSDKLDDIIAKYSETGGYQPEVISELNSILNRIESLSIRIEDSGIELNDIVWSSTFPEEEEEVYDKWEEDFYGYESEGDNLDDEPLDDGEQEFYV